MQLFHRQANGAATVIVAVVGGLVTAGAKGSVARAREHNGAHLVVITRLVESLDQFIAGGATKGIHLVGTIDGDPGNAIAGFVKYVFELHGNLQTVESAAISHSWSDRRRC